MLEKKTLWAVTRAFNIVQRTVIVDEGKILVSKNINSGDDEYYPNDGVYLCYFDTYEQAKDYVENESAAIREMVPKVRNFIVRMDYYRLRKTLGIERKEYLGDYAEKPDPDDDERYQDECKYAKMLETFILNRMLNIDGFFIPLDQVRHVKWFGKDGSDNDDPDDWKARLTMTNGDEFETCSKEEVRLVWAVFGKYVGQYYIDNNFDYNKDEEK